MKILIAAAALAVAGSANAQQAPATPHTVQIIDLGAMAPPEMIRSAEPIGDPMRWAQPGDYPAESIAARHEGRVMIEIALGSDGKAQDCRVTRSSELVSTANSYAEHYEVKAAPELERRACALTRERGAFRYALDRDGRPMASVERLMVNFLLKDTGGSLYFSPAPMDPSRPRPVLKNPGDTALRNMPAADFPNKAPSAAVTISARGVATQCHIQANSGTDRGDIAICRHMAGVRFTPGRDPTGRKVEPGLFVRLHVEP